MDFSLLSALCGKSGWKSVRWIVKGYTLHDRTMHAKKCRTQAHIDLCDLYPRNFVLNVESAIDYLDALKVSECTVKLTSACVRTHVLSRQRSISEQFLQDICHAISRAAPAWAFARRKRSFVLFGSNLSASFNRWTCKLRKLSKIRRHSSTVLSYTHCFAEFFQRHAYCSDIHQTERAMLLYLILITRRHSVNGVHYLERLFIDTSSLFKLFVTCWRSTSIESEQSTWKAVFL